MPPLTTTNTNTPPTPLIPPPLTDTDTDSSTFAGLKVTRAKDTVRDAWCMLVYGNPGTGKTTLAGMFADYPAARDVLIVDVEGGATAVADRDYIDVVQAQKWSDVDRVIRTLETTQTKYRTVVFDNLTEMQMLNMKTIVSTGGDIGIQHWGKNTANMLEFTRRARDLARFKAINIVLLAWRGDNVNEHTNRVKDGVALTNKLAERLPGVVNVVGYLSILDNPPLHTRHLSFAASPRTDAKFRRTRGSAGTPTDTATSIPLELYYGVQDNPILDILRTLYDGVPFPAARYTRPTRATTATTTPPAATTSV